MISIDQSQSELQKAVNKLCMRPHLTDGSDYPLMKDKKNKKTSGFSVFAIACHTSFFIFVYIWEEHSKFLKNTSRLVDLILLISGVLKYYSGFTHIQCIRKQF